MVIRLVLLTTAYWLLSPSLLLGAAGAAGVILEDDSQTEDFQAVSPEALELVAEFENSINVTEDYDSSNNSSTLDDFLLGGENSGYDPANISNSSEARFIPSYPVLRDPLTVVIPVTLAFAIILLIGLIGNVSTCVVIAKNNYMHTATNYYLFSLAVSDLLLLISGLPQEMYLTWLKWPYIFGEAFCLIRGLAAETSANATVLTITAFTVERYVAICHPLRSHKLSQLSRVITIILLIWVFALALALPQAAQFGVVDEIQQGHVVIEKAWCTIKREIIPYAFQVSICVFFVIPMTMITALYVLIGLKLRRSRGPSRTNHELTVEPRNTNRHSQSHVIRMLVAVVVAFFICWAPFHIQRLMAIYSDFLGLPSSPVLSLLYKIIFYVSGILYYVGTCINPILYHIMSNKFRQAFKDTMGQLFGRPSRIQHRTYSSISHHRSSRMGVHHHLHHPHHNHQHHLHHPQNHFGNRLTGEIIHHQETCINCRHPPPTCSCRGNSHKYVRTYNLDQTGNDHTTVSLLSNSPSDKAPVIALASLDTSKGPPVVHHQQAGAGAAGTTATVKSEQPSGLKAFLSLRGLSNNNRNTKENGSSKLHTPHPSSTSIITRLNGNNPSSGGGGGKTSWKNRIRSPGSGDKSTRQKSNGKTLNSNGAPVSSTGGGRTTKMMLILTKGRRKKAAAAAAASEDLSESPTISDYVFQQGVPNNATTTNAPGMRDSAGVPCSILVDSRNKTCRAISQTSVDSNNTISNSSLQDLDESEYTGEELAGVLAELKESLESPKII